MDTYYHPHDLGKFADMGKGNKALWDKFQSYYSAVFAEGALTEREKALIALAVAHTVQCPYCIDIHATNARKAGAIDAELAEAAIVAAALRAGGAITHATHALNT